MALLSGSIGRRYYEAPSHRDRVNSVAGTHHAPSPGHLRQRGMTAPHQRLATSRRRALMKPDSPSAGMS
jgi:hypothetical protein